MRHLIIKLNLSMKKILFILIIIVFVSSCSKKEHDTLIIQSKFLPSEDTVLVFTPANYSPEEKYPLVILLHGWSGNYNQWNSITNLQQFADVYNFVIACPDGFYDSWYINSKKMQFEDFFKNNFLTKLKSEYSLDTNNFFITGLSMGGHGAITLFLKNPTIFKSAASTSGILDLTQFPDRWSIKDGIGSIKDFPELWQNNSAFYLLDSANIGDKIMFIDCGTEDFAYEVNLNFVKKCQDLGFNFKFISIPGNHSRKHWRKMIDKHLEFFNKQVK